MRVDRNRRIGRWPSLEVRQMLRRLGTEARDLPTVALRWGMREAEARRTLAALGRLGYVARDPDPAHAAPWRRTRHGDELAGASISRPLTRAQARRMLTRFLRRVAEVNRKRHFLCRVTAVGVFGSYLTDTLAIDELDIAIQVVPKAPAPGTGHAVFRPDRSLPYWRLRRLLTPREWPRWRERHVELHLATGPRGLVLHRFGDPILHGQRVRLVFVDDPEGAPDPAPVGVSPLDSGMRGPGGS